MNNKGSFTVEATIIFSVVLLCTAALFLALILLHQQVKIKSLADRAVVHGAMIWASPSRDMIIGKVTREQIIDKSLYYRLLDTDKNSKIDKVKRYIENELTLQNGSKLDNIDIRVDVYNYLIYKKLKVYISRSYPLPFGKMLKPLGFGEKFHITATSDSSINDPTEFIRNSDFFIDIAKEIDKENGGNVTNRITLIFDKIQNFLN